MTRLVRKISKCCAVSCWLLACASAPPPEAPAPAEPRPIAQPSASPPTPRERPYEYDDWALDSDKDGIADPDDHCPTEPGPRNQIREKHGCPKLIELNDGKQRYKYDDRHRDSDGDGVMDPQDHCPTEPKTITEGGAPGCPKLIEILD